MNRTKFMKVVTVNDVDELDYLDNTLASFAIVYTPRYYRVSVHDLMRPDRVSFLHYGTVAYWWIICLVNNIQNPMVDIIEGQILKIPNVRDVYNFYTRFNVR